MNIYMVAKSTQVGMVTSAMMSCMSCLIVVPQGDELLALSNLLIDARCQFPKGGWA